MKFSLKKSIRTVKVFPNGCESFWPFSNTASGLIWVICNKHSLILCFCKPTRGSEGVQNLKYSYRYDWKKIAKVAISLWVLA